MTTDNLRARRAWAAALRKHLKPGHVYFPELQHDKWCAIYTPSQYCNCDPIRILKDDRGRVLARVDGAGSYDPLELIGGAT